MSLRVGLYNRVSTDEQDATKGMDRLQAWAQASGHTVRAAWTDTISGRSHIRPGRDQLLAMAKRGALDAIAVEKLDRWGRSVLDVHTTIKDLTALKVGFISTTQGIDTTSGTNALSGAFLGLLAVFAEFEREIISERTKAAMAQAKARGKHVGRPRKGTLSKPVEGQPFPGVVSTPPFRNPVQPATPIVVSGEQVNHER